MVYLVSYDLNRPGQNYASIIGEIKKLGPFIPVLKSAWLVDTSRTAIQIQDALYPVIDVTDRLFITRVPGWGGWIEKTVIAWLQARGL
jgi:hypothetical protein